MSEDNIWILNKEGTKAVLHRRKEGSTEFISTGIEIQPTLTRDNE